MGNYIAIAEPSHPLVAWIVTQDHDAYEVSSLRAW